MKIETDDEFGVEAAFLALPTKRRRGDHSAKGRRRRENKPPRKPLGETKVAQFAIRVFPTMRAKITAWADAVDEYEITYTERAWAERAMRLGLIPPDHEVVRAWMMIGQQMGIGLGKDGAQ